MTGDLPGTSGGGAVIYPPASPISTPLSSNGNGGGQHRQTRHQRANVVFTDTGDVDNGAGEAGAVFTFYNPLRHIMDIQYRSRAAVGRLGLGLVLELRLGLIISVEYSQCAYMCSAE